MTYECRLLKGAGEIKGSRVRNKSIITGKLKNAILSMTNKEVSYKAVRAVYIGSAEHLVLVSEAEELHETLTEHSDKKWFGGSREHTWGRRN